MDRYTLLHQWSIVIIDSLLWQRQFGDAERFFLKIHCQLSKTESSDIFFCLYEATVLLHLKYRTNGAQHEWQQLADFVISTCKLQEFQQNNMRFVAALVVAKLAYKYKDQQLASAALPLLVGCENCKDELLKAQCCKWQSRLELRKMNRDNLTEQQQRQMKMGRSGFLTDVPPTFYLPSAHKTVKSSKQDAGVQCDMREETLVNAPSKCKQ